MRRFVDLHTHSNASDGQFAPADIIRLADEAKLAAVAITDHDTIDGLAEARAAVEQYPELTFVSGIEVSASFDGGSAHIVGLCIDEEAGDLASAMEFMRQARRDRNPLIIDRLRGLGCDISLEEVAALVSENRQGSDGLIGRVHIAEVLRRKGIVHTTQEAFDRFIAAGGPAYVGRERLSPAETCKAIISSGGIAILAHPGLLRWDNTAQLARIVASMKRAGIGGVEAYHSSHSPQVTRACLDVAKKYSLFVTGGSDFHGGNRPDVRVGYPRTPRSQLSGELAKRIFGGS